MASIRWAKRQMKKLWPKDKKEREAWIADGLFPPTKEDCRFYRQRESLLKYKAFED